jgi:hypothetical protein
MKLSKQIKQAVVRSIMLDVPKPNKANRHQIVQAALTKAMSPECRKVFTRTPEVLAEKHTGDTTYDGVRWSTRHVRLGDAPEKVLDEVIHKFRQEDEAYGKARDNLEMAVMACNTLKQLADTFPEFQKYMPTEQQPTKNLPALANVVADLSKLGWPKGVK